MIERSLGVTIGDRTREWVKALPMRKLAGKLVLAAASLYSDRIRAGLKKNKMKHKKNIFSTFVQCATLNTTTIPSNYFSFATFVFVVCAMRAHHTNANKVSLFCLLFASLPAKYHFMCFSREKSFFPQVGNRCQKNSITASIHSTHRNLGK